MGSLSNEMYEEDRERIVKMDVACQAVETGPAECGEPELFPFRIR